MLLTLKPNNTNLIVCYDNFGTIYFHNENTNTYYFLTIDNDNNLEILESYNMHKLLNHETDNQITFKKCFNTNNEYSLKGKINDELNKNKDEPTHDDDIFKDPDFQSLYYPESKYCYVDDNDNSSVDDDEFMFYKSGDSEILKLLQIDMTSPSNYDVIVMNYETKTTYMTIRRASENDYVLIIYTNGLFELNSVGSSRKVFELFTENTETETLINAKCIKSTLVQF